MVSFHRGLKMEEILEIISNWNNVSQGVFFFGIFSAIIMLIDRVTYYITVLIKGWPPRD